MRQVIRHLWLLAVCAAPFGVSEIGGCGPSPAPTTQPQSLSDRQNRALEDPMGYKVPPPRDVSGGDLGNFDRKGFDKDVNDLVNP